MPASWHHPSLPAWPARSAAVALSLVICVALAALIVVAVRTAPPSPVASGHPEPLQWVDASESATTLREPVDVRLVWREPPRILAPQGLTGTVTSVQVAAGDPISSGQVLLQVDGRPVVALATAAPLWRSITDDSTGPDVADLGAALADLGYLDRGAVRERVLPSLKTAVARFGNDRGLAVPPDDAVLDASVLAWLPSDGFVVGEVPDDLVPASPAPGGGQVLATGRSPLASATVVSPEGAGPDGPTPLPGPAVLVVDGKRLVLDAEGRAVQHLDHLAALVEPGAERITGVVRELAEALSTFRLPAGAVIVGVDGGTCVLRPSGEIVRVVVVTGGPGTVDVAEPVGTVAQNPVVERGVAKRCLPGA